MGRELEDAFMHIPKYIPRESQLFLGPEVLERHLGQEIRQAVASYLNRGIICLDEH